MQIPYKAEFFSRDFTFQGYAVIPEPEIKMDYLTLEKTTIFLAAVTDISRGWYCRITQGKTDVYQGIVSSVEHSKQTTSVKLLPMVSLFDVQVYRDRTTYTKQNLEGWMAGIITLNFINSSDSIQNINGLTVSVQTSTNNIALNLTDNIHDFWTIAKKAIENAKIVISCSFDPQAQTVSARIKSYASASEVTIEADFPNVIDQKFSLRDDWGSVNKCTIVNRDDETQQLVFYSSDYAAPTVHKIQAITIGEGETFADAAQDKANELLRNSDFDNLIELCFRNDDQIIPDLEIGQPCRIIKSGTVYHTVLTGISRQNGVKTLIFGGIRADLTQILKLKGGV